ncbi:DNA-binding HxlR family transcriptional regulator [Sphingopyxis panaciterrae]|uniref:winged helix-turn-helix transcriptional regulator n=1 Tax=Sphingopyxis panaciterrae TaxID=363841 RepID=UPI001ABB3C1A|nr:helix-turn-helix domain-containing protein [Sphingopyxis panaciterrae]NIJ35511.1 DNA-binding HxlR family transcriptional regulator [Sphingopyxis panaciterrae]
MATSNPLGPEANMPTPMTDCPMTAAIHAIGGKWSLICLYYLASGTRRFNELRRLIPDVSHKVLTETLRGLEEERLIVRAVHSLAPSHVEYEISPHGVSVLPVMHAIRAWGRTHLDYRRQGMAGTAARR